MKLDELKEAIQGILVGSGEFVYVLGSKNTGKSLVFSNFEKLNLNNVFVVKGFDILDGMISVLRERRKTYLEMKEMGTLKDWTATATGGAEASVFSCAKEFGEFDAIMNALLLKDSVDQSTGALISELVKRLDGKVTIIIDEAQRALAITPPTNKYDVMALESALALFTAVKKDNYREVGLNCLVM